MPVEIDEKEGKYRFNLQNSTSSAFEIYAFGATVTSWKSKGQEQLFLSDKAILNGTKAIRGGIPLVFPQFGTGPNSPTIQHGFARICKWKFLGLDKDSAEELTVRFMLDSDNEVIKKFPEFPHKFQMIYTVTLTETKLKTEFHLKNTGDKEFGFTALLHTYFKVDDIKNVSVVGLKSMKYHDKVSSQSNVVETRDAVTVSSEVDRVYIGAAPETSKYLELVEDKKSRVKIYSFGFQDVVVWNPWIEKAKAMADFGEHNYPKMICIELGSVDAQVILKSKSEWKAGQSLAVHNK